MAKNRNRRRAEQVPNRRLPRRPDMSPDLSRVTGVSIKDIRRAFQIIPDRIVRPRVYQGPIFRPIVRPRSIQRVFQNPVLTQTRVCVKRRERKEVLFALDRAGRSGSAPKKHYRRTPDSKVRC